MVRSTHGGVSQALARERLGIPAVVFFILAAAAPLTVVAGTLTMAYGVTGNLGLPVAFLLVGGVLAIFSVGYVAMSRHLPHAGAFYAYGAHGLSPVIGVGMAWVSIATYSLLQVALYGGIGAAVSPLVQAWIGVEFPWWVFALASWSLVAFLGLARVEISGHVLAVLLVAEVVLVVGYDIPFVTHPAQGMAWGSWSPVELFGESSTLGAAFAVTVLGFVGFEASVVFSEESRNPRRTVPAATYVSLGVIAVLYGVSAWAMAVAVGPAAIAAVAAEQGPEVLFGTAATHLGPAAAVVGHSLFATSILAAMISFHATVARYVFALGREGVLPSVFGRTSSSGAPQAGSLAQSATGLIVIVGFAVTGADPLVGLFYITATTGGVGVLMLLTVTAAAVLGFFANDSRQENAWRTRVAPALSLVLLTTMLIIVLRNYGALIGVAESSPLRWGMPAMFAVVAVAGCGWGAWLRIYRPDVYRVIGRGPRTSAPSAPQAVPDAEGVIR